MTDVRTGRILAALPLFDACIRFASFTRAAERMDLTQSAVTRRIQTLEADLGVALFRREGRVLKPTEDGLKLWQYATEVLKGLDIANADFGVAGDERLRVGVLPSLGSRWLTPRLGPFIAGHPGLRIELVTIDADFGTGRKDPITWDPGTLDVVITWGRGSWRPLRSQMLFEERMLVVAAPDLVERHALTTPEAVIAAPRLIHTTRARAWTGWAERKGIHDAGQGQGSLAFEHYFMVIEAARARLGVALVPDFLVEHELLGGGLATVPGTEWKTGASYWSVTNPAARTTPVTLSFMRFVAQIGAGAPLRL